MEFRSHRLGFCRWSSPADKPKYGGVLASRNQLWRRWGPELRIAEHAGAHSDACRTRRRAHLAHTRKLRRRGIHHATDHADPHFSGVAGCRQCWLPDTVERPFAFCGPEFHHRAARDLSVSKLRRGWKGSVRAAYETDRTRQPDEADGEIAMRVAVIDPRLRG